MMLYIAVTLAICTFALALGSIAYTVAKSVLVLLIPPRIATTCILNDVNLFEVVKSNTELL